MAQQSEVHDSHSQAQTYLFLSKISMKLQRKIKIINLPCNLYRKIIAC